MTSTATPVSHSISWEPAGSRPYQSAAVWARPDENSSKTLTVLCRGPHDESETGHQDNLTIQLENASEDIEKLYIIESAPSDIEWSLLGKKFKCVQQLVAHSGYNEDLNDAEIPHHWPLERLEFNSACGEVMRSPMILEGKVKHLSLFLTCGLRFEGPTNAELCRANREAIERGEEEAEFMTVREGTPEEGKIELISIPKLVHKWMSNKYNEQVIEEAITDSPNSSMETLEIIENDAMDTFGRMALAVPNILSNLKNLVVRSTSGLDHRLSPKDMFFEVLPQLIHLETLTLSTTEVFDDEEDPSTLYKSFPPNLSVLRFRGPVSLSKSSNWHDWVKFFADPESLPNLTHLSFVLDMYYEKDPEKSRGKKNIAAPEDMLREARQACDQIYTAAKARGVSIEVFHDQWADRLSWLKQVDGRWDKIS